MEYNKEIFEKSGLFIFENAFPKDLCQETIEKFEQDKKNHHPGEVGSGYKPEMKSSTDWYLGSSFPKLEEIYFSGIINATYPIMETKPQLKRFELSYSGFQYQKSPKNKGFFHWHTDNDFSNLEKERLLAVIIYLNDVHEGGHTEFMQQRFSIKPETGKLAIFPTTWEYFHRGVAPKSNDKHIMTSFGMTPRLPY